MTIAEMRVLLSMPEGDYSDAQVVAAYAALIDDGFPAPLNIVEPVTVDMARAQSQIEDEIPDDLISQKIRSAREWVEQHTSRIVAQRTLVDHFRAWGGYLSLSKRPIISVDAIAYNMADGDATYLDGAYAIGPLPLRIYPGASGWPKLRAGGAITVAYTAGYDPAEVPQPLIEAILVLAAGMISQREGAYAQSLTAARELLKYLRPRTL